MEDRLLKVGAEPALPRESKCRRVAKFLILIGSDQAAEVLSHLDEKQVEAISVEIASIRGIGPEEADGILAEFRELFSSPYAYTGVCSGGVDEARRLLYAAFGPEKGEALLQRAAPPADVLFGFLEDFSAEQIAFLLRDEAPQAAAMVLARLKPALSAAVLEKVDGERKLDIVKRIARQGEVAPEVLERFAEGLREKARTIGRDDAASIDGMGALAAILKSSDVSFGDKLLDELSGTNPDLEKDLRSRLYTLDDVCRMEDRTLQKKLVSLADRDIALLLKGKNNDFTEKLLSCVSSARRAAIREEMDIMGAVKKQDVETATYAFLSWFRTVAPSCLVSEDEFVGEAVAGKIVTP